MKRVTFLNNKKVIIIGAGGHASVCLEILIKKKINIIGFTNLDNKKISFEGVKFLGDDSEILNYDKNDVNLVNAIGPSPKNNFREEVSKKFSGLGYSFLPLIHPSAIIADNVKISQGVQIMAGSIVQPGSIIGSHSVINTNSSIDHDCLIGNFVHIAPSVTLCGGISVGDNSYVGSSAVIIENLSLGKSSIVGAGVTLRKDLKDSEKYTG